MYLQVIWEPLLIQVKVEIWLWAVDWIWVASMYLSFLLGPASVHFAYEHIKIQEGSGNMVASDVLVSKAASHHFHLIN